MVTHDAASTMEDADNACGSDEDNELCVVCCRDMQIYSIMDCNHTICHECSTRLRVLCEKLECPICRQKTTMALFSSRRGSYHSLHGLALHTDDRYQLAFEGGHTRQAFHRLLAHRCPQCPHGESFETFQQLRQHVTDEHDLFYCDICVTHLKLFSRERKLYTRDLLERHLREGDAGDDSHSGHPLCHLCQQRHVDHEELYLHMRRDHYHCHLCEADGHLAFCRNVSELQEHFRRKHYLCEEGECRDKRLIVFRTNIDLQAHRASAHSEGSAATSGCNRTQRQGPPVLTLQFSRTPGRRRRLDRRGSSELVFESSSPVTINPDSRLEFPSFADSPPGPIPPISTSTPSTAPSTLSTSTAVPASPPTGPAGLSFNVNRRPAQANVTINVNRRPGAAQAGLGSPTGTQPRISQVSSSGNITMQSPTMEQPPLIRGGRLVSDLESLYGARQEPPPRPQSQPPAAQSQSPTAQSQPPAAQSQTQSPGEQSQPPEAQTHQLQSQKSSRLEEELASSPQHSPTLESSQLPIGTSTPSETLPSPRRVQNSPPNSSQPLPPTPRSYSGTNSVRFSVAGGGWTAPADPLVTSPQRDVTSQLRHLALGGSSPGSVTSPVGVASVTGGGGGRWKYSPPENLQARSCRLVKLARDLCRSEETLRTFRQLSAEFRCGQLTGELYYGRCLSLLGAERLARLFPELLVLLPDIDKQTELLAAHEALNKDGSHRHKFLRCPTCCQILTLSDWGRHSAVHFRNGEFPPECL